MALEEDHVIYKLDSSACGRNKSISTIMDNEVMKVIMNGGFN